MFPFIFHEATPPDPLNLVSLSRSRGFARVAENPAARARSFSTLTVSWEPVTEKLATSPPRAFLSYRHAEFKGNDAASAAHRSWVSRFAAELQAGGVDVLWDDGIRQVLSRHTSIDPIELPLCKEIARTFPTICDVFLPILTPGYAARIGSHARPGEGIPHGVLFEEWQGASSLAVRGKLRLIPILRLGDLKDFDGLSRFFSPSAYIDLRGEDESKYRIGLSAAVERIRTVGCERSHVDVQTWCDAYIQWCRMAFPERVGVPADIWPFHTGAAMQFLDAFYERVSCEENLPVSGINILLRTWQDELRALAVQTQRALKCTEIHDFVADAVRTLDGEYGWQHLGKTVDFCIAELARGAVDGDALERARAHRAVGVACCWLAEYARDSAQFELAMKHLRSASDGLTLEGNPGEWLRLQRGVADALKAWAELEGDGPRLREARSVFEDIIRLSKRTGQKRELKRARWAIADIDAKYKDKEAIAARGPARLLQLIRNFLARWISP